jgi:hypothetical protein
LFSVFIALLSLFITGEKSFAKKPSPPLQISITPVRADISASDIKPGDVVELKVSAVSFIDAQEMRVEVNLIGGAKLVKGDTSWSGPASKKEEKTLILTVQAPEKEKGRIKARVSSPPSGGARFSAEAEFILGPEVKTKPEKEPQVKKDSKGRSIVEYR